MIKIVKTQHYSEEVKNEAIRIYVNNKKLPKEQIYKKIRDTLGPSIPTVKRWILKYDEKVKKKTAQLANVDAKKGLNVIKELLNVHKDASEVLDVCKSTNDYNQYNRTLNNIIKLLSVYSDIMGIKQEKVDNIEIKVTVVNPVVEKKKKKVIDGE